MKLGEDLEIEILLRLPEKSLSRFKCVQKSWNNIINSPYFATRRRKLQIRKKHNLLLILQNAPNMKFIFCDGGNEKPIPIKSLFPQDVARIETYGSCNGVFCLKGISSCITRHDQLILWNPTTKEVHLIPHAPSLGNHYSDESLYGFGAVNDDFKVVKLNISDTNRMAKVNFLLKADVYDLITKSWTPLVRRPPTTMVTRLQPSRYNTLVNGVYHWITSSDGSNAAKILCFDFCNNQFRKLEAPKLGHHIPFFCDEVVEIKGYLAYVVQYRCSMVWLEIWTMEQNRWAKQYNIDTNRSMFHIYGLWNDGTEILVGEFGQRKLTSCDHHGNVLRQFQLDALENACFWFYEYVPSIAPLSK